MNEEAILSLLKEDGNGYFDLRLARSLGLNEAIIYDSLCRVMEISQKNNALDDEGYFSCTAIELQQMTTLTRRQQVLAVDNLIEAGLVLTKIKGLPAKKYYLIMRDAFEEVIKD